MRRPHVPKYPVKKQDHRFVQAVQSIVIYQEMAKAALKKLSWEKRLSPPHEFRLQVEVNFCSNLLTQIFKVDKVELVRLAEAVIASEKFETELADFCSAIAPEKPLIVTPDEFRHEVAHAAQQGRLVLTK